MAKSQTKKVRGKEIRVSAGEKKPVDRVNPFEVFDSGDLYSRVSTQEAIMSWFHKVYPRAQRVDRKNGIVYHLDGKKAVKEPTRENVGGLFFGTHLNEGLDEARLVDISVAVDIKMHMKGNRKVGASIARITAREICKAFYKVHPPPQID